MYIITVRQITSGELLTQRKGLRIAGGHGKYLLASRQFALMPITAARRYLALDWPAVQATFVKWLRPGSLSRVNQGPSPK